MDWQEILSDYDNAKKALWGSQETKIGTRIKKSVTTIYGVLIIKLAKPSRRTIFFLREFLQ